MSRLGDFIAFQAAVALLKDNGKENVLDEVHQACKEAEANGKLHEQNFVKAIYESFTSEQISEKRLLMLKPHDVKIDV